MAQSTLNAVRGTARWAATGAIIGGAGGALLGTEFLPGVGTVAGAKGGAICGAFIGGAAYNLYNSFKKTTTEMTEGLNSVLR